MKFVKATLMLATVATLTTSCGQQSGSKLIEKPNVTVENKQFTPELLNALGRVSDPQVSPDGTKILYGITYQDVEQNKGNRELWVMDANGENAQQLTRTDNSETNAVGMDGGNKIAIVYKDDKEGAVPQMWVMNADGSGRKCVSDMENGVEGFVLSPDESKVVLISTVKYGKTAQDHHPDLDKT